MAMGNESAPYPYDYPTLFSMAAAFLGAWIGSVTDRSARANAARKAFDGLERRALLGAHAKSE
jgi:cation/acetate symporter